MGDSFKSDPAEAKGMLGGEAPFVLEINDSTSCGIWFIRGSFLQKFANKKAFIALNGILGLIMSASYVYFSGTITTIEKRFKLDSRTTGFISIGNDVSTFLFGALITYWAGKQGHKPRWIALGVYTVVLFCLLNLLPHYLYGPGEDALSLTTEFGGSFMNASVTQDVLEKHNKQMLCQNREGASVKCQSDEGGTGPAAILFIAQFISGVGGSLYFTLGTTYMDDNIKKSKTPALISISYFIRMLGPALGSALSGYCLSLYISPDLHPKIDNRDPRWLGAWWLGWIILSIPMFIIASLLALFPRQLPRAYFRRQQSQQSQKETPVEEEKASIKDFFVTIKRMLKNKIYMCNNLASIFYLLGYMPFWTFGAKYTEIMFKTSAAKASFVTGTIGLGFSAAGLLISGLYISKFKPSARQMAGWNVFVSLLAVVGLTSYAFIGCVTEDQKGLSETSNELQTTYPCNENCHCDFVKYSPVCAHGETFISPCHAGCKNYVNFPNGSKIFTECSCVKNQTTTGVPLPSMANPGPCPSDCTTRFHIYLVVVCILKFFGATGRATNFLVAMRCVDEKDKPASMGFGSFLMSLLAFIPSPIIFGYIIDSTCLVWGRTCTGTGNCWLYNAMQLKYVLSFSAGFFVFIGTMFDVGVWYLVKDLKVFDDEDIKDNDKDKEMKEMKNGKPKTEKKSETG